MKRLKGFKFAIYPTLEQRVLLEKTFGCTRFLYNKMLDDKIQHYEQTKENLLLTPAKYKDAYPFLKEVDCMALINTQRNLERAYRNFFREERYGFPRWKSKHKSKKAYTTNMIHNNIELKDGFIKMPKLKMVKIRQHRQIPSDYQLKSVTISQKANGKYEASLLYEYEISVVQKKVEKVIGLDYAQSCLYVDSEGSSAQYPHYYIVWENRLAKEQRKLSHMKKNSHNWQRQRNKISEIYEKINHQRRDFLHKRSKQIANVWDAVIVEDLNMMELSKSLHLGKNLMDNAYGLFRNYLAYKLQDQGKQLIRVDRYFASSKTCSACGNVRDAIAIDNRLFHCPMCGFQLDRDHNAAINLKNEGRKLLLEI